MTKGQALDSGDPLKAFRDRFLIEEPDLIYLDGNSLGRTPITAVERLSRAVKTEWSERLVRGWGEGWIEAPRRLGDKIGQLIGAKPGETLLCDSTSVNFFKLVVGALKARPGRTKIVTDNLNFPSDIYLLQGVIEMLGDSHRLEIVPSLDGLHGARFDGVLDEDTALVTLSHTAFKSGFVYDMAAVTSAAHQSGALTLWDLSHSVGAVPLDLRHTRADLAVGCTYKYLNGGPGSPAFLYVRDDLQEELKSPIWGWFGQQDPFAFDLQYQPAPGIGRFQAGTPPILSMLTVESGVDLLLEAGMDPIRAKSVLQTDFVIELWREHLEPRGVTLNSPLNSDLRGSHVSLGHSDGMRVDRALIEDMNVIPDFRSPDNIRLGVCPLYTTFEEIERAIERFARVLQDGVHLKYPLEPPAVT